MSHLGHITSLIIYFIRNGINLARHLHINHRSLTHHLPHPTLEDRQKVIASVRSACHDYGFLQLTGHGIPLSLQQEILTCAKRLFSLPLAQKQAMAMSKSMGLSKRGYEAVGGQKLDDKPDTKEGFYIGVEIPPEHPTAGTFVKGPNFWPVGLSDEEFRRPVMEYHSRVLKLHELLLGILAEGMKYGVNVFDGFMEDAVANIKLLHYPPNAPNKGEEELSLGAGTHTDFGCTTILLQQPNHHGLQVLYLRTSSWIPVPAKEDVLIVNVADLLQRWTGGEYRSAVHRVVNVSEGDRYSVPFFYHGNSSTKLAPLDGSWSGDGKEKTVEEHIRGRFVKTFGS